MREFVKLSPKFWVGPTGRAIRKSGVNAQVVALYLMSSPHTNYIALFRLPLSYVCEDTGLSVAEVKAALATLERVGFARYDDDSETAWVVKGTAWQVGEAITVGDKRVSMLRREFSEVPSDCPFKAEYLAMYSRTHHFTGVPTARVSQPRAGMSVKGAIVDAEMTVAQVAAEAAQAAEAAVVTVSAEDKAAAEQASAAAKTARTQREQALLAQELDGFQAIREQEGLSTPAEDKRVAALILAIASRHGTSFASDSLGYAASTGDYDLSKLTAEVAALGTVVPAHAVEYDTADI